MPEDIPVNLKPQLTTYVSAQIDHADFSSVDGDLLPTGCRTGPDQQNHIIVTPGFDSQVYGMRQTVEWLTRPGAGR